MTPIADTACPKCGNRCHYMAGVNVPSGDPHEAYLVCWTDRMAKVVSVQSQWSKLGKKSDSIQWIKRSKTHWQTLVKGRILDYWPTKKKWCYANETRIGDVEKFVRGMQ